MGEFRPPITAAGYVTIPKYLRERYLTPDAEVAVVQAIGTSLQVLIPSENKNLLLQLEFEDWQQGGPRKRSINDGAIYVDRWRDCLKTVVDGTEKYVVAEDQEAPDIYGE